MQPVRLSRRQVNGLGTDDKLRSKNGATIRYFLTDHLGSTEALTDASGAIVSSTSYDSFGNVTSNVGSAASSTGSAASSIATTYRYTRREYDEDTGLYYYRNRWYDPEIGRLISEDPIGFAGAVWSEAFKYDSRSNLIERIDARGVKTKLSYLKGGMLDPLNRLQKVEYDKSGADTTKGTIHEAADITYNYMTSGDKERIASVVANGVSTERYTYDAEGRVANYRQEITGRTSQPLEMSYLYDTGNRLTEVRYPAAYGRTGNPRRRVSVKYDETSRLKELQVDNKVQMDQIVYNDYGQTTSIRVGGAGSSALTETYEYNGDNGLLTRQKVKRGTSSLMDISYGYARNSTSSGRLRGITGNLTRVVNHLDKNQNRIYSYDARGRLIVARGGRAAGGGTVATGVTTSWHQGYKYDERGNRVERDSRGVPSDGKSASINGITKWTYDSRTNRITSVNHEYDNAGSMVRGKASDGTIQRYEYDEAGRLVKVKTDAGALLEEYGYGRSRERVKKTKQDGTKVYYAWGGSSVLVEYEEGASLTTLSWTKSYVYAGSRLLSTITKTGSTETTEYHHPDRLGTKLITTATTAKEQSTLPYGTVITSETTASTNQKFTSYDRSDKTGLDYAVNRTYSSEQARFLQPDPIGMASVDLTDPQSLNMYTYAGNNPIDLVDPSGTLPVGPFEGYTFCTAQYAYCGGIGPIVGRWGLYDYDEDYSLFGEPPPAAARAEARYLSMLNRNKYDPKTGRYTGEVRVQLLDEEGKNLVHETVLQKPTLEQVFRLATKYAEVMGRNQIKEKAEKEGLLRYIELTPHGKGFMFEVTSSDAAKELEGFLDDPTRFSKSTSKFHYWFHSKKLDCGNGDCTDYRSRKGYMSSGSMQIVYNSRLKKGYIDVDKYAAHGSGILQTLGHGWEVIGRGKLPSVPRVKYRGLPPQPPFK